MGDAANAKKHQQIPPLRCGMTNKKSRFFSAAE
jgi:hypothetical protein